MGTNRTFQDMLNDHLNYTLLREELVRRDYILQKVEKDDTWVGGSLIVPFQGAHASSIAFGSLTSSSDVSESKYIRGEISTQPEIWATLQFNHRDLLEHGKISEKNFLKILPDEIDSMLDYMKQVVSINILNGSFFATINVDGTSGGVLGVDRVERFTIGQKVGLKGTAQALAYYYVTAINVNSSTITVSATRGGSAADVSAYTVADAAKCYHDGAVSNGLTSLKSSMLSAANGGSSTLFGVSKLLYPYLQSINVDGSSITSSNLIGTIFDAFTTIRNRGKGNPLTVLMSYKHLGTVMKQIEASKGAYNVVPGSTKVTNYGWNEIEIMSVKGTLKVVAIQEADDDAIFFIDWRALKFHSNGFFRKRMSPDGKEYYEVRATTGYYYLVDVCLFGDLVLNRPSYCGILHSISY